MQVSLSFSSCKKVGMDLDEIEYELSESATRGRSFWVMTRSLGRDKGGEG